VRERKQWAYFLICLLFVVVGALMATLGHGSERHAGIYCVLFFGAGVIVLLPLRRVAGDAAIKLRTIGGEPAFEVSLPSGRTIRLAIGALCITVACVGMAIEPHTLESSRWGPGSIRVVGIVGALWFGAATVRHVVKRRADQLLLTRDRVTAAVGISTLSARWDDIAVIQEFDWKVGRFGAKVTLLGFDVPRDRVERSALAQLIPMRPGGYGITFPTKELPDWLPEELDRYRSDPDARALAARDRLLARHHDPAGARDAETVQLARG
jgi:hypothetical protein